MTLPNLISAATLAAALPDPQLRVVDCRSDLADPGWGQRQYSAGHLPGAVLASLNANLSGPITADSGRHPLPSPEAFAATLSAWGLTPGTRVVAYDQGPGPYAARLWWLLRAAGHAQVQVLDGGWAAWTGGGHPVSQAAGPLPAATTVSPRPFEGWVSTGQLAAALATDAPLLVDARGADRFAGQNETIDPVAGHVPGALNHPFTGNLGPEGRFLPPAALRDRWLATLAGRSPGTLISMCGSGVTACHNLLALETAGLGGGRLYPGSWSEWIRDPHRARATAGDTT